jgi:hypothetical protein
VRLTVFEYDSKSGSSRPALTDVAEPGQA